MHMENSRDHDTSKSIEKRGIFRSKETQDTFYLREINVI